MRRRAVLFGLIAAGLGVAVARAQDEPLKIHVYREGQVWEYATRKGEEGSLLKIQRIEEERRVKGGHVYHITVVGVRLSADDKATIIGHAPVTAQSLDASVTRLSKAETVFPSADEGIDAWKRAKGGVFRSPVARIVEMIDEATKGRTF